MPELTTHIIRERKPAFELEEQYRALYDSLSCPNVYLSPEWVFTWLLSLGCSYNVCFLTCRLDDELAGVWPFFEYTQPVFGTGLMPIGAQVADSFDPVAKPECLSALV